MREKLQRGIKKYKTKFIMALILWVVLSIVFVSPLSIAIAEMAKSEEGFKAFIETIGKVITNPFTAIGQALSYEYIGSFWGLLWKFTIFYIIVVGIGLAKAVPKTEYGDIEHGSSDWCEGGEEYKVLSRNKGILLAQKEYLPVDKRGNVNVLVVGRFRFW